MGIKGKITFLIVSLILIVATSLSFVFFKNLNQIMNNDIKMSHSIVMKIKKDELINKMDLAFHILDMYYERSTPMYMKDVVEKQLINKQYMLFSELNGIYNNYKDKLSSEKLEKLLLEIIKNSRYGNNGYFWVNNFSYKMIMHPIKPEYDNKIFKNTPKVPFVELGINALKDKNEAFIEYRFYNPVTKKYEFKVSLVKVFKPYNWIIGTGEYISDVTKLEQQHVIDDIRSLRYGKNGYFWINNLNYKMIMHPIKPEYDNKIFKNTPKVPFVKLGVNALKNKNEAFIEYKFYNPSTKKYEKKLSFVRLFKQWNWIIGTGTYRFFNNVKEIDKDIKKTYYLFYKDLIEKVILIGIIILIVFILIGYYFTMVWIIKPMDNLNNSKEYFEEIATFDYLTKIMNRRSFFEKSRTLIELAKNKNISLCIIMIDIDFFKKINDTYGHEVGDRVLKTVTSRISSIIRIEDIFGRIGGEEFAILMLNCNQINLSKITEKIRKEIENCRVNYKEQEIKCTISLGAYIVKDEKTIDEMLKKSDELLYKAKNNGRNRVEIE